MKIIFKLLLLVFILFGFSNPNIKHEPFVGYWTWKNNNKTFMVHIYSRHDMLKGDYWLTETVNGNNITIYKSDKVVDTVFNFNFGNAIAGNSNNGKKFSGIVKDNVLLGDGVHGIREGELSFVLLSSKTAKWKIKHLETFDKKRKKEPENFSIPTNIILTKVKNY